MQCNTLNGKQTIDLIMKLKELFVGKNNNNMQLKSL